MTWNFVEKQTTLCTDIRSNDKYMDMAYILGQYNFGIRPAYMVIHGNPAGERQVITMQG